MEDGEKEKKKEGSARKNEEEEEKRRKNKISFFTLSCRFSSDHLSNCSVASPALFVALLPSSSVTCLSVLSRVSISSILNLSSPSVRHRTLSFSLALQVFHWFSFSLPAHTLSLSTEYVFDILPLVTSAKLQEYFRAASSLAHPNDERFAVLIGNDLPKNVTSCHSVLSRENHCEKANRQ